MTGIHGLEGRGEDDSGTQEMGEFWNHRGHWGALRKKRKKAVLTTEYTELRGKRRMNAGRLLSSVLFCFKVVARHGDSDGWGNTPPATSWHPEVRARAGRERRGWGNTPPATSWHPPPGGTKDRATWHSVGCSSVAPGSSVPSVVHLPGKWRFMTLADGTGLRVGLAY